MMKVILNKRAVEVDLGTTVATLLSDHNIKPQGVATAVNGQVVPAKLRDVTTLNEGDNVVVITAFYGG